MENSPPGIHTMPAGAFVGAGAVLGTVGANGEVLAAGAEKVGAAFFEKNKNWKEKGAVPLELGANLAVYLASAESNGITGKLISAQWDPWPALHQHREELAKTDIYCLRRIVPEDRGKQWGGKLTTY